MTNQRQRYNFRRVELIKKTEANKQEKRKISLKPLKTFFSLLLLVGAIYTAFFSPVFEIREVKSDGVKSIEISDYLQKTLVGKNILIFQPGRYLRKLSKEYPILEEAKIIRGLPSTIQILAKEKKQVLVLCNLENCFEIDNKGFAYQQTIKSEKEIALIDEKNVQIQEGDKVFPESFIGFYLDAIEQLSKMDVHIKEARMQETTFKITFLTEEGYSIITDSSYSLENQLSALQQVLDKNKEDLKEYIDLRVEGVAYVK